MNQSINRSIETWNTNHQSFIHLKTITHKHIYENMYVYM